MVNRPHLGIFQGAEGSNARSEELLRQLAHRLRVPRRIAQQLALTHTLRCLQRREPLYLQALPDALLEPIPDHNWDPEDV